MTPAPTSNEPPHCRWLYLRGPQTRRVLPPIPLAAGPAQPTLPNDDGPPAPSYEQPVDIESRRMAAIIAIAAVEALSGLRPTSQLRSKFVPSVVHLVEHLRQTSPVERLHIHSLRVQSPTEGVIEVAIHLRGATQSHAIALRAVRRPTGWMCTKLELSLRPNHILRAPSSKNRPRYGIAPG